MVLIPHPIFLNFVNRFLITQKCFIKSVFVKFSKQFIVYTRVTRRLYFFGTLYFLAWMFTKNQVVEKINLCWFLFLFCFPGQRRSRKMGWAETSRNGIWEKTSPSHLLLWISQVSSICPSWWYSFAFFASKYLKCPSYQIMSGMSFKRAK